MHQSSWMDAMSSRAARAWSTFAEGFCWALGLVSLSLWGAFQLAGTAGARHEMARVAVLEAVALPGRGRPVDGFTP
jgi:hypothetical protein